ncbi:hypothetical protein [Sorangium sp. So ce887]|uniref:hypothetical protein n=1 Tax=Sorangium sp. So ce887 TaxID=3133324 RepID=UPI003F62BDEA
MGNEFEVANRCDPLPVPVLLGPLNPDRTRSEGIDPTRAQPASPGLRELAMVDPSPPAAVVASLADTLTRAVALGDDEAARVVHEALDRLRGHPPAPEEGASKAALEAAHRIGTACPQLRQEGDCL